VVLRELYPRSGQLSFAKILSGLNPLTNQPHSLTRNGLWRVGCNNVTSSRGDGKIGRMEFFARHDNFGEPQNANT
jgi:hypothetical protein